MERPDSPVAQHAQQFEMGYKIAALLFLLLIVYLTMYSFRFDFSMNRLLKNLSDMDMIPFHNRRGRLAFGADFLSNILLYIPFGYSLFCYFTSGREYRQERSIAKTLLAAATLSFTTELLQLFLPNRFCSVNDLLNNTAGAYLGCVLAKWNRSKIENLLFGIHGYLKSYPLILLWLGLAAIQAILALFPFVLTIYPRLLADNLRHWLHSLSGLLDSPHVLLTRTNFETFCLAVLLSGLAVKIIRQHFLSDKAGSRVVCALMLAFYPFLAGTQFFMKGNEPQVGFILLGMCGSVCGMVAGWQLLKPAGEGILAMKQAQNRWLLLQTLFYGLLLVFFFFYPFRLDFGQQRHLLQASVNWLPFNDLVSELSIQYVLHNFKILCMAIPVGFYCSRKIPWARLSIKLAGVGVFCLISAISIELLQIFISSQSTDTGEVFDFVLGGLVGVLLEVCWQKYFHQQKITIPDPLDTA